MNPHVEQISPQTIHLHSIWWQSMEGTSLHCEMYLHPVVQESSPHPGNNLVADWLEDGENWKLKLEILIINREGRKKVRWCGTAMRLGSLANEVFCLSWNACDIPHPPNAAGISRPGEKKDYLAIWDCRPYSWYSCKFVFCPCGFFPLLCHFLWQANMSGSWYVRPQ